MKNTLVEIYWQTVGFIVTWLPLIALAALAAAFLWLTLRQWYVRRLSLGMSPEESVLRRLAAAGRITPEEAERLVVAGNPLPEVRELAPAPDLRLKLSAAFGRIVGALAAVLALCQLLILAGGAGLVGELVGNTRWSVDSPPWLWAAVYGLVLAAGVAGVVAGGALLRGSRCARGWLIAAWLVELVTLRLVIRGEYAWWCLGPVYAAGLYSLWTLAPRNRAKVLLGALWLAALAAGVFLVAGAPVYSKVVIQVIYSGGGGDPDALSLPVERIVVFQGSPEPETLIAAREIAARLGTLIEVPWEARGFDAVMEPETGDASSTLLLYLARVYDPQSVSPVDGDGNLVFTRLLADWTLEQVAFPADAPQIIYSLYRLSNRQSSFAAGGLGAPALNIAIDTQARFAVAAMPLEELGARVGEHFAGELAPLLEQHRAKRRILPPPLGDYDRPLPPLALDGLPEARLIFHGCVGGRVTEIYRFRIDRDPRDIAGELEECLSAVGLRFNFGYPREHRYTEYDYISDGLVWTAYFSCRFAGSDSATGYGTLRLEREGVARAPDPGLVERYLELDPDSFILSGGLRLLEAGRRDALFRAFIARDGWSFEELNAVIAAGAVPDDELPPAWRRLVELAFDERNDRSFMGKYPENILYLFDTSAILPRTEELRDIIRTSLGMDYRRFAVDTAPVAGAAFAVTEISIPFADGGGDPLRGVVELEFPGTRSEPILMVLELIGDDAQGYLPALGHKGMVAGRQSKAETGRRRFYAGFERSERNRLDGVVGGAVMDDSSLPEPALDQVTVYGRFNMRGKRCELRIFYPAAWSD